jgi:hypothetical protein
MDVSTVGRKRRRLTIALAVMGLVMAAVIWAYSELIDSSHPKPFNSTLWTAFMILCPPSVLSIPLIDVEPGSSDFAIMASGVIDCIEFERKRPVTKRRDWGQLGQFHA